MTSLNSLLVGYVLAATQRCLPLPWSFRWSQPSRVGCSAGGRRGSVCCQPAGRWGRAGGRQRVVCRCWQMGWCAPPDAALWTSGRPRCRRPGSWSHVGLLWPPSPDWSTELEGFSSHSWPVSPPSTACTRAWRKTDASVGWQALCGLDPVGWRFCIRSVSDVMPWVQCGWWIIMVLTASMITASAATELKGHWACGDVMMMSEGSSQDTSHPRV